MRMDTELITKNIELWKTANKEDAKSAEATKYREIVVTEIKKKPEELLKELKTEQLVRLALPYLGAEDPIYQAGRSALHSENDTSIRNIVEEIYGPDSTFRKIAVMHPTTLLKESLEKIVSRKEREHMANNLKFDNKTRTIQKPATIKFITEHATTDDQMLRIGLEYEAAKAA